MNLLVAGELTPPTNNSSSTSDGMIGFIIGFSVVFVLILAVICIGLWIDRKKKRKNNKELPKEQTYSIKSDPASENNENEHTK